MKGGYQILDLSTVTVGTKTETKGAFEQAKGNNGKPVMVLTPDNQRVFAEVVESSGDYTLAYLGGDGSTYTVLVEDDDNVTITKQESDATIATKVAALETAVGDVTDLDTTSKEVVGAINEVNSNLTVLVKRKNITNSESITIDANQNKLVTLNYSIDPGYSAVGVITITLGGVGELVLRGFAVTNTYVEVYIMNTSSSAKTITANTLDFNILLIKTDVITLS